nr:SusC/RagA family TonB-linked outer membrane protein [Pedobacter panaciterrae]
MYKIYTRNLGMLSRHIRKILFIMRLTTVIIIAAMLQVSASTFAQKVTFRQKETTIKQLFKEITNQTGFNLVWNERKLNVDQIIEANFNNTPLKEVLDKTLSHLPLTYTIDNKMIVIMEKEQSLIDKVISHFKEVEIVGKVVDEDGNPLAGATVKLQGTKTTARTNENGLFTIISKEEDGILAISYLGYLTEQINFSLDNPGPFKVVLKLANSALQEVQINAGYYTVTDRERTGSISRVTTETIEKQPISNPLQALQGRITGLVITQQTGIPGGGFTVRLRGQNSISSGNDPLYIIDGVIYPSAKISSNSSASIIAEASPLSMINPSDIESIEVLKDADATAIYGSRGANGIILITTKNGKKNGQRVNAEIKQGFSQVEHHIDLLNTEEYIQMRKEAFKNDNKTPSAIQYDINGTWDESKYTDWQKELIGGTASSTNASMSIAGGNDNSNYLIGGNYYTEGTVFPGDFNYKRGGLHSSLTIGSTADPLNIIINTNYSHAQSNLMRTDLTSLILMSPNAPDPYDGYGKLNFENNTVYQNPMASLLSTNNAVTDNLVSNMNLNYHMLTNITLKLSVGYNTIKRTELVKIPLSYYPPFFEYTSSDRTSDFSDNYNNSFIVEPQITYKAKLGPGNLDALVGMTFQTNNSQIRTIEGTGFSSDELMENIASAAMLKSNELRLTKYRYSAGFARINYSLLNKYYLNLTARRDGSSRFGDGKQFANFGAVGIAWIFSEENFIKKNLAFLSFGKVRFSYGITGNDQIPDYGYLQLWNSSSGTYQGRSTITPIRIANPDFAWETNKKREASLQLGFLNERLITEFSYYRNRSSNQLVGSSLPPSVPFGSIQANLPATIENRGWEFEGNFKIINTKNWLWSTGFNLTIPKSKLIAYPGLETSDNAFNYAIGEPLTIRKVYNVTVDGKSGIYTMEDKDGNGIINNYDRYINKFIGQYYYGGLQNSIRFKNLNLNFLIAFVNQKGNNYMKETPYSPGVWYVNSPVGNQPSVVLSRWQNDGDRTLIQKFSTSVGPYIQYLDASNIGGLSIDNASYIRLKNLSLSFFLPKKWLNKMKVKNTEISLQGQNVFTISNYIGLDPESQRINSLPPLRTIAIGLKLTF